MRPESQKILQNIGTYVGAFFGVMGMVIAIAASPLFGSIFSLIFIVVFGLAFGLPYLRKRKSKQLLKTGIQANGKIVEMRYNTKNKWEIYRIRNDRKLELVGFTVHK